MIPRLHEIRALRRLVLPTLKALNPGNIKVRHHWTGDPVTLDAFRHKGYWYHGKSRERQSMQLFSELIRPGDAVLEVGGHIGYLSLYFASLVGQTGKVVVLEPGPNNLRYLRENVAAKPWVTVVECAACNYVGAAELHTENLTGQNNTLLERYATRVANEERSFIADVGADVVTVACTTVDALLQQPEQVPPSFVKIDVEGAELAVLQGMTQTLASSRLALMVEVTEKSAEVSELLLDAGYRLFSEGKQSIVRGGRLHGNVFCLKPEDVRVNRFGI
jgi:FkbM family methyltransferase